MPAVVEKVRATNAVITGENVDLDLGAGSTVREVDALRERRLLEPGSPSCGYEQQCERTHIESTHETAFGVIYVLLRLLYDSAAQ